MIDFSIQPNRITPQHLELNMVKEGGVLADISWRKCVDQRERDSLKVALRVAICDQIIRYKLRNEHLCALCGTSSKETLYHVDHVNHFEEILCGFYEFLKTTSLTIPSTFRDIESNQKAFRPEDSTFEEAWKHYHEEKACLRILCAPCNLRRPKWNPVPVGR